jgi:hypothetical protein
MHNNKIVIFILLWEHLANVSVCLTKMAHHICFNNFDKNVGNW